MSERRVLPSLTRAKLATATGVLGLIVGVGIGASDAEPKDAAATAKPLVESSGLTAEDLEAAVDAAVNASASELERRMSQSEADAQSALKKFQKRAKTAQRRAVTAAVAKARKVERAKAARQVAQARAAAAPAQPQQPQPLAGAAGGTDRRFSYCYEAIAAGYGPYVRGRDVEYDWYRDADGDGTVCE